MVKAIQSQAAVEPEVLVRQLQEEDLPNADRIMRLAFGTFIGLPEPASFMGDAQYVATRWRTDPAAAFVAIQEGEIVGSNFATNWGSVGFFGPLTVRPDLWDRGVGKLLMQPIDECFSRWGTTHAGLFTFAQSQKHVGLYQKFGFWPRFLTAIMAKEVGNLNNESGSTKFSEASAAEREAAIVECRNLTDRIYEGLNLEREIRAVYDQRLGDTVLLWDDSRLVGFAVCHIGAGSEAGSGSCYVKFGAVFPNRDAAVNFDRLLNACAFLASSREAARVVAGVNIARINAYQQMLAGGFRTQMQGIAMHRPNEAGYDRADAYIIDDWR